MKKIIMLIGLILMLGSCTVDEYDPVTEPPHYYTITWEYNHWFKSPIDGSMTLNYPNEYLTVVNDVMVYSDKAPSSFVDKKVDYVITSNKTETRLYYTQMGFTMDMLRKGIYTSTYTFDNRFGVYEITYLYKY